MHPLKLSCPGCPDGWDRVAALKCGERLNNGPEFNAESCRKGYIVVKLGVKRDTTESISQKRSQICGSGSAHPVNRGGQQH